MRVPSVSLAGVVIGVGVLLVVFLVGFVVAFLGSLRSVADIGFTLPAPGGEEGPSPHVFPPGVLIIYTI
ncbi:hypothetical protein BJI49_13540 [Acetobacter pasteurianus]|nr:hypothetical protein BJI49_13540 [Acetobacter pasteurianus]GCD50992.1 hypothetical protein NBRC106471_2548 [Acetobacter pasteurianus subsp. pasteurianus LMG 1262 = NBRC 106471]